MRMPLRPYLSLLLAVSSNGKDPYELADMVAGVNMEQVDLAERLSNQVYHYDKNLREIKLATDTPNKRLDSFVLGEMEIEKRSR